MALSLTVPNPILMLDAGIHEVNAVLALPDQDAALWPRTQLPPADIVPAVHDFLSLHGLEQPDMTLLCGMGTHDDAARSPEGRAQRMARWRQALLRSGGVAEDCFCDAPSGWEIDELQAALKPALGHILATDSGIAAVLAALSIENLRDRSWNEGVTVVFADDVHTQAFMLFREKIHGLYENHADLPKDALLADLKEVRLNWLPDEQVRAAGGHGCICGDFPAEAEGFRPTWILGPRRESLAGAGRLASPCGDARFERCFGMLYGLERRMFK